MTRIEEATDWPEYSQKDCKNLDPHARHVHVQKMKRREMRSWMRISGTWLFW